MNKIKIYPNETKYNPVTQSAINIYDNRGTYAPTVLYDNVNKMDISFRPIPFRNYESEQIQRDKLEVLKYRMRDIEIENEKAKTRYEIENCERTHRTDNLGEIDYAEYDKMKNLFFERAGNTVEDININKFTRYVPEIKVDNYEMHSINNFYNALLSLKTNVNQNVLNKVEEICSLKNFSPTNLQDLKEVYNIVLNNKDYVETRSVAPGISVEVGHVNAIDQVFKRDVDSDVYTMLNGSQDYKEVAQEVHLRCMDFETKYMRSVNQIEYNDFILQTCKNKNIVTESTVYLSYINDIKSIDLNAQINKEFVDTLYVTSKNLKSDAEQILLHTKNKTMTDEVVIRYLSALGQYEVNLMELKMKNFDFDNEKVRLISSNVAKVNSLLINNYKYLSDEEKVYMLKNIIYTKDVALMGLKNKRDILTQYHNALNLHEKKLVVLHNAKYKNFGATKYFSTLRSIEPKDFILQSQSNKRDVETIIRLIDHTTSQEVNLIGENYKEFSDTKYKTSLNTIINSFVKTLYTFQGEDKSMILNKYYNTCNQLLTKSVNLITNNFNREYVDTVNYNANMGMEERLDSTVGTFVEFKGEGGMHYTPSYGVVPAISYNDESINNMLLANLE